MGTFLRTLYGPQEGIWRVARLECVRSRQSGRVLRWTFSHAQVIPVLCTFCFWEVTPAALVPANGYPWGAKRKKYGVSYQLWCSWSTEVKQKLVPELNLSCDITVAILITILRFFILNSFLESQCFHRVWKNYKSINRVWKTGAN